MISRLKSTTTQISEHLKRAQYFYEDEMDFYFETEDIPFFEITRGYSIEGILFFTAVVYKNKLGIPFMIYENVDQDPGFYRRINTNGSHSEKTFDTFYECMNYHGVNIVP